MNYRATNFGDPPFKRSVTVSKHPNLQTFSTTPLPMAEQFEAWRQLNGSAMALTLADGATQPFPAAMNIWDLGGLVYTHATLPADVRLQWSHWLHRPLNHWCLVIPNPNQMQAGQRVIGFRSLSGPFKGEACYSDVHTLYIPRSLFGDRASVLDNVASKVPDTGLGALLADYLLHVQVRLPKMNANELPRLVEATRVMLLACMLPTPDRLHRARGAITETVFERARQLVQQNLLSPHLGPDFLIAKLGMSRSNLYRLFEHDGGIERFIRRHRLHDAHAILSSPQNSSTIQAIGEARGFQDAASFSRAFRREFGYPPGAAKAMPNPRQPPLDPMDEYQMLGKLLRQL